MPKLVLIVDDEKEFRELYSKVMEEAGFNTIMVSSTEEALEAFQNKKPDLIISDVKMSGKDGISLLRSIREVDHETPFLLVTAHANIKDAVTSLQLGAVNYLEKPVDMNELRSLVTGLLKTHETEFDLPEKSMNGIVAESPLMRSIFADAYRAAESNATILITGESGSGKEVLSQFIHNNSSRKSSPFIAVNCAAIPASILGSELFGHEKGAFTGALSKRSGRFREADGGTLFLDEIGDMPLELQPSLLRAIENGKITPVGSDTEQTVDIRLIAATNKKLNEYVSEGKFREDLYYRLNVITIEIPPLRERPEDILPLARHFLKSRKLNKRPSAAVERILQNHPWPGNVRELANAMERASVLSRTEIIMPQHLPPNLRKNPAAINESENDALRTLKQREDEAIRKALEKTGGNQTKAAELLGISRRTLINKLKKIELS
jgi:two-component system response regulator HydG